VDLQERLTRRFGPGVAGWCARLPALTRSLASRWTLDLGEPFPAGNSSVAIRCTRSDGSPAVLKLSPDLPVVAEQVTTLRLFGASGRVPAVLAADLAAGAVLLELIEPGITASELRPPPSARDWAGLLTALHSVPVPPGFPQDLRAQCEGFFDRIGRRISEPEVGRWVSAADVTRGAVRCEALLSTQTTRVLLHGDLHLALAAASGLDAGRLHDWCRAVAPIVAITYLRRPGSSAAVAELAALSSE
jgi:streptomycin 6-kinase